MLAKSFVAFVCIAAVASGSMVFAHGGGGHGGGGHGGGHGGHSGGHHSGGHYHSGGHHSGGITVAAVLVDSAASIMDMVAITEATDLRIVDTAITRRTIHSPLSSSPSCQRLK